VLSPLGLLDWARVPVRLASRRPGLDRDVERFQGKHFAVRTTGEHPLQLDGDPARAPRTCS